MHSGSRYYYLTLALTQPLVILVAGSFCQDITTSCSLRFKNCTFFFLTKIMYYVCLVYISFDKVVASEDTKLLVFCVILSLMPSTD
jgi:hypothetical protein